MFRPLRTTRSARRGNTLIVTLSCLSLLAVVGITAVYFTGDQATRAKTQGQAQADDVFPDNGLPAFNSALSSLIYDGSDTGQGLLNALRGHSLMATMYSRVTGATTAWDGVGTFDEATPPFGVSRRALFVNHRVFPGMTDVVDPEWSATRPLAGAPGTGVGQTFIPKNPAYTYPDIKDLYLASICPATGEVLVPSFYRDHVFGGLQPGNPNWTSPQGRHLILRPRGGPGGDHPLFPPVPPDADGRYRGDVRNRPGGYYFDGTRYVAHNDSIWVDIGLPPITLPGGRRVKPLVAVLVTDLDSLLNLNAHGNMMNSGAHASGQGLGRWEISLQKVLQAEGQAIVNARGAAPQTRSGMTQRAFDPRLPTGQQLPSYSAVSWRGLGGANPASLILPGNGANPFISSFPTFDANYDSTNNPALTPGHAALFNSREWNSTPSPMRTFAIGDSKLLQSKHAYTRGFYASMEAGPFAPTNLQGTRPTPFPNPPQQTTTNGSRTDPAHAIRGIFTGYNGGRDLTGLSPASTQTRALNGGLAGIDMNRPLADYRAVSTAPLSPDNLAPQSVTVGTALPVRAAEADRQFFCRDIFARLIAANSPALASVDAVGNVTITATPAANPMEYALLRNLAQVAVNMCDFRDEDEISTPFIWNPVAPLDPFAGVAAFTPNDLNDRVVFGVEKSRLVIGEAYSEQVTNPMDNAAPPTRNSHIRFWVELMNPGTAGAGTQDDGGAQVYYPATMATPAFNPYRIEIARYTRTGAMGAENLGAFLDPTLHPENVTGSFDPAYQPEIRFQFDSASVTGNPNNQRVRPNAATYDPVGNPMQGIMLVAPTIAMAKPSEFNPTAIVPPATTPAPPWNNAVIANAPAGAGNFQNAMAYETGGVPMAADANRADYKRHVVLLRRLANPHMPEGPFNPYVTVDYMDHVPAFDALTRLQGENMDRNAGAGGYTDFANRYAIGKVQPHAGLSVGVPAGATNDPTFTFPNSMVLAQAPTAPVPAQQPKHTFGRHNGIGATAPGGPTTPPAPPGDTLLTPYEWLVHLDRQLVNQMELIHVTTTKPHMLTQQFIGPDGMGGVRRHGSSLFTGTPATSQLFTTQMYRVLDLLRVRGHGEGDSLHGRKPGLININTIQDKRIWDSLFDVQAGNGFTQAQVDAMWNNLILSRTRTMAARHGPTGVQLADTANLPYNTPIPGPTIYDMNAPDNAGAPYDRPFLPFGVSQHAGASALPGGATAFGGTQGIDDTILRRINTTTGLIDPTQLPTIFQNAGLHPYQQAEAARKILNSTTTVSNSFAVWVTVGYFDVVSETPSAIPLPTGGNAQFVTLGAEYSRQVTGDTRHKFFAIVDRSQIGLDPASFAAATPVYTHATVRPFCTTVEQTVYASPTAPSTTLAIATDAAGNVYSEGVPVAIGAGSTLVVGTGANQEIVTVNNLATTMNDPVTGRMVSTFQLTTPMTKNHPAGENVSNVVYGNPGPQPSFDVNNAMYQPVVPHWSRVP